MIERRNDPRVEVSHPVIYVPDVYPRPKIAKTVDLSMGGTKIESQYSLAEDEGLALTICTDSEVVKCRGKVIYVVGLGNDKLHAGIQFEGLSEGDELYLRQYLSYVMEQRA